MSVLLSKDGFMKKKKNKWEKIPFDLDFFKYWRSKLEVKGVTLLQLIEILLENKEALELLEKLTNSNILSFVDSIDDTQVETDLELIVVKKYITIIQNETYGSVDYTIYCSGKFKVPQQDQQFDIIHEHCAIDFCDWNELKILPIVFDNTISIVSYNDDQSNKIGEYETYISVGEFFSSIFDELCFFGEPLERDEQKDQINDMMEELDKGQLKTRKYEDLRKELKGQFGS